MQYKNITKAFIGIQGVLLKNFHDYGNFIQFDAETNKKLQKCPVCGCFTNKVHDYRFQKIQHSATYDGRIILLKLRKRRYVCTHCNKKFYEYYDFLEKYFRKSTNVYNKIISDLKSLKNFKTVAKENYVSVPTVVRYLSYEILLRNKHSVTTLPEKIGIDEFKGNCNGTKYQFHIFDLDTHKTIDIVESRKYDSLERYFSKIQNRKDVKVVSMDLYNPFKRIIKDKFINAKIVADRFHYTRIVMQALDQKRLNLWRLSSGLEKKYFKNCKLILAKKIVNTTKEQKERLIHLFEISPHLFEAYKLKEEFLAISDLDTYEKRENAFKQWLNNAECSTLPEFDSVVKTLRQWHEYVSRSYKTNYSNGAVEGKNNLIKTLKRISFGYRNLRNFRNRILLLELN